MSEDDRRSVIIIEDDDFIRQGLGLILTSHRNYRVVNSYSSCEEALQGIGRINPDIVLLDIELPGMTGLEGIRLIKNKVVHARIIMMTQHAEIDFITEAFQEGAIGYIVKNKPEFFRDIMNAFADLDEGGAPVNNEVINKLVESFRKNNDSPISNRESTILRMLTKGKSYTQIANDLNISKHTARAHIRNIYQKLDVNSKSAAIEKASAERLI